MMISRCRAWQIGRKGLLRNAFSAENVTPAGLDYEVEPDLPVIKAELKNPKLSGRPKRNDKLREFGKTPALLCNIPSADGNLRQQILAINTTHFLRIIKTVGGNDAFFSHVLRMKVKEEDGIQEYRVLPRQIRFSRENFKPNSATFRVLRPDDVIKVSVPVKIVGEDTCPGVKQNGFPFKLKYALTVQCRGDNVPGHLPADISKLEFNEKLFLKDIPLPPNVKFLNMDPKQCVCKIQAFK